MEVSRRILIVEDHPLTRQGLALVLAGQPDLAVCGFAATAAEACELIRREAPDLVLVETSVPGLQGFAFIRQLHAQWPALHLFVFTHNGTAPCAERAIRAGARGYVVKQEPEAVLLQALRHVLDGGLYVSRRLNDQLLLMIATDHAGYLPSPAEVLSRQELACFELTGQGLGTQEIAARLHISVKTVESYRLRTKKKLHLHSVTELVQHAVQWVAREGAC